MAPIKQCSTAWWYKCVPIEGPICKLRD